jgi:ribosomal protein L3-specific protein-(glutamine-N5) methyltransferase
VLATLHLPRDTLEPWLDAHLTKNERLTLLNNLQQRVVHRLPTAYLVQEAWLGPYRFYVDQRVIVPRSYFAELLESGFAPWIEDAESVTSALDLCTGSGCLAILMAHAFPNAEVDAIDISPDALAVARRNIADYALEDRVRAVESDLFAAVKGKRYDLILSNPPYVTSEAMEALPAEYRHEPCAGAGRRCRRAGRGAAHPGPCARAPESRRRAGDRGRPQPGPRHRGLPRPAGGLARHRARRGQGLPRHPRGPATPRKHRA